MTNSSIAKRVRCNKEVLSVTVSIIVFGSTFFLVIGMICALLKLDYGLLFFYISSPLIVYYNLVLRNYRHMKNGLLKRCEFSFNPFIKNEVEGFYHFNLKLIVKNEFRLNLEEKEDLLVFYSKIDSQLRVHPALFYALFSLGLFVFNINSMWFVNQLNNEGLNVPFYCVMLTTLYIVLLWFLWLLTDEFINKEYRNGLFLK